MISVMFVNYPPTIEHSIYDCKYMKPFWGVIERITELVYMFCAHFSIRQSVHRRLCGGHLPFAIYIKNGSFCHQKTHREMEIFA